MKRVKRTFAVAVAMAALAASIFVPNSASAGGVTINDNPTANPPAWDTALGGKSVNAAGTVSNCDTLNAVLSPNKNFFAYNNGPPVQNGAPNPRGCLGEADIQSFSLDSTTVPGKLTWKMTTRQLPRPGTPPSTLAAAGGGEFGYYVFFQNPRRQNARQIIGDAPDCTRFSHAGPYLTGNNEYFFLYWDVHLGPTGTYQVRNHGWGRWDPVGNILYQTRTSADAPQSNVLSRFCSGTPATHQTVNFPGTGVNLSYSGNTMTMSVPFNYCWINLSNIVNCYEIAAPGDQIVGVQAATHGGVFIGTPDLQSSGGPGPTGAGQNLLVDWAPYAAYDYGTFTPQTERLPGPNCPNFATAAEYFTSNESPVTPAYVTIGKGPGGADNDYQVNPNYGLNRYDASGETGNKNQSPALPTGPQNHHGATTCDIFIPTAARFIAGAGGSFTV
ncbi:MAG TPA: hypothetical protein VM841_07460 [Actinomycetota bacterium]|nr:hypothetical protein [Actinomycetota bacterium]